MPSVDSSTRNGTGRIRTGMGRPASGSRNSWRPLWDDMAPRVVFIRSKSPAGLEPRLAKEAATLARAGYEVHAVLWDRERAFRAEETRDGIRIHRYQLLAPEGQPELAALLPRWWWYASRRNHERPGEPRGRGENRGPGPFRRLLWGHDLERSRPHRPRGGVRGNWRSTRGRRPRPGRGGAPGHNRDVAREHLSRHDPL